MRSFRDETEECTTALTLKNTKKERSSYPDISEGQNRVNNNKIHDESIVRKDSEFKKNLRRVLAGSQGLENARNAIKRLKNYVNSGRSINFNL